MPWAIISIIIQNVYGKVRSLAQVIDYCKHFPVHKFYEQYILMCLPHIYNAKQRQCIKISK